MATPPSRTRARSPSQIGEVEKSETAKAGTDSKSGSGSGSGDTKSSTTSAAKPSTPAGTSTSVSPRSPRPSPSTSDDRAASSSGKDVPCPDALPARSRSGAPPLVVAVVTAAIVAGDLAALHRRAADLGPEVDAVVATRDLSVGTVLEPADLATRPVHRSQLPTRCATDRTAIIGRVVAVPVLNGAYVVTRRNVAPRHRARARRRRAPRDAGDPRRGHRRARAAPARPSTCSPPTIPRPRRSEVDGTTDVVADGVTVLRVDRRAGSGAGRAGAAGVTLLVDPEQAAALADAQANGVVTLALVPPEDAAHP